MQLGNIERFKSWLISAGMVVAVSLWLISGQFGDSTEVATSSVITDAGRNASKTAVRVRTQSAEKVMRTITVNGKTAPARSVELAAETDGRVEYIGAALGASLQRGAVIARVDKRDREARLAQAEATVKQREVEYEGRARLKSASYVSEAQLQEAVALLQAARAELTRARLDLDYMTIDAPFDGALLSRVVEVGDFVKRGDPISIYVDNRTIIVSANI